MGRNYHKLEISGNAHWMRFRGLTARHGVQLTNDGLDEPDAVPVRFYRILHIDGRHHTFSYAIYMEPETAHAIGHGEEAGYSYYGSMSVITAEPLNVVLYSREGGYGMYFRKALEEFGEEYQWGALAHKLGLASKET